MMDEFGVWQRSRNLLPLAAPPARPSARPQHHHRQLPHLLGRFSPLRQIKAVIHGFPGLNHPRLTLHQHQRPVRIRVLGSHPARAEPPQQPAEQRGHPQHELPNHGHAEDRGGERRLLGRGSVDQRHAPDHRPRVGPRDERGTGSERGVMEHEVEGPAADAQAQRLRGAGDGRGRLLSRRVRGRGLLEGTGVHDLLDNARGAARSRWRWREALAWEVEDHHVEATGFEGPVEAAEGEGSRGEAGEDEDAVRGRDALEAGGHDEDARRGIEVQHATDDELVPLESTPRPRRKKAGKKEREEEDINGEVEKEAEGDRAGRRWCGWAARRAVVRCHGGAAGGSGERIVRRHFFFFWLGLVAIATR